MKICQLRTHQKTNFNGEDLVFNPKEFPELNVNDVVEIYHPEDNYSRLLLQATTLNNDFQQKETVSVEASVATFFQLRMYNDVCVNVVNKEDVALDLLELQFKEQYFSRSDMWRLRASMINTCVYYKKKVCLAEMRAQASELWSKGDKVACGVVTENTRVTFRSSTAQVNIFIQMSSEMWEFDNYGDLYFEKAVGGFLSDLFDLWKEKNSLHDVTITLFSRTFYDVEHRDEIPPHMRTCIQQDYQGRFYEDFYRVVVQNERYDEWTPSVIKLKTLFHQYQQMVLHYHEREGVEVPRAWNSTAAQGNFLEVLNMGLNVFEKYYLDRPFDRTGKLSMVITPGSGVFEVDRSLATLTKQRTIDCGNGSDLVCLGEQPLHAVPLFRFVNKRHSSDDEPDSDKDVEFLDLHPRNSQVDSDDYHIPHWINHSFYTSKTQALVQMKGKFIPRIKIPESLQELVRKQSQGGEDSRKTLSNSTNKTQPLLSAREELPFMDYDEYDAQVFKRPTKGPARKSGLQRPHSTRAKSYSILEERIRSKRKRSHKSSNNSSVFDGEAGSPSSSSPAISIAMKKPQQFLSNSFEEDLIINTAKTESREDLLRLSVVGSAATPVTRHSRNSLYGYRPQKALINPFAPSRLHFKVTSNRRRWAHAYPTDLRGATVQLHHQHSHYTVSESSSHFGTSPPPREVRMAAENAVHYRRQRSQRLSECSDGGEHTSPVPRAKTGSSAESGGSLQVSFRASGPGLTPVSSTGALSLKTADSTCSLSSMVKEEQGSTPGRERQRTVSSSFGLNLNRTWSYPRETSEANLAGHAWLWGLTGEQEWTPDLTTGMDWKSLTIPASLPITTDFFPDSRSLQHDYMIAQYNILPNDINYDIWQRLPSSGRKPLTTEQVYKEMVGQRLAQGFQIVTLHRPLSSPLSTPSVPSLYRSKERQQTIEEHVLSIGRQFHKLSLVNVPGQEPTITVKRYWPKFPYPEMSITYKYRFQVPDSDMYNISWTNFCNEKLEAYNWNYVDQYICTRGEGEYGLRDSLKYWRSRFFLLPINSLATKKILEGAEYCDIYEERSMAEQQQLIDGFLRWLETANKIRRPGQNRKPKIAMSRRSSVTQLPTSTGATENNSSKSSMSKPLKPPLTHSVSDAGYLPGTPTMDSIGSARQEKSTLSESTPLPEVAAAMMDLNEGIAFLPTNHPYLPELPKYCFITAEATAWVLSNIEGVQNVTRATEFLQRLVDEEFMCHASGNPNHRFIHGFYLFCMTHQKEESGIDYHRTTFQYEWCEVAIHGGESEPDTLPSFLLEKLPPKPDPPMGQSKRDVVQKSSSKLSGCSTHSMERSSSIEDLQAFISKDTSIREGWSPAYKLVVVDVDPTKKSEREEWGTARYHGNYCPTAAFELETHWLVATGQILGDLVNSWARKATSSCGFHFLPVPVDLFALPYTQNSDPLRGPIFVPLKISCLRQDGKHLFEEFDPNTREQRQQLFQEAILKKFGFMPVSYHQTVDNSTGWHDDVSLQYVHCSGGMFALIPDNKLVADEMASSSVNSSPDKGREIQKGSKVTWGTSPEKHGTSPNRKSFMRDSRSLAGKSPDNTNLGTHIKRRHRTPSPFYLQREYIRSRAESFLDEPPFQYEIGFLWCWNFMLTKKWRSSSTGDEHFQDKMLADFRAFCSNANNRLVEYWDMCKSEVSNLLVVNDTLEHFDDEIATP